MTRPIQRIVLLLAATAAFAAIATTASAYPSQSSRCTNCHSGSNVTVSATLASNNGTNATYDFSSPGADTVAVFDGSTRLSYHNATSGQFTVPVGKTYTVYAVSGPGTNDGIGSTSVSPVVPPPADTTAPVTTSDALTTYLSSATIKLTATDGVSGSGVATTYYRLDGGVQTAGTTVNVTGDGAHSLEFWSVDVAGNIESPKTADFTITTPPVPPSKTLIPVAGASRFDTAVETSKRAFPTGLDLSGARTVLIATGRNWPDALGGTALAGLLDGPVLLVDTNSIPASVLAEITRLQATNAIILGGTPAVGQAVEDELVALLGAGNVERLSGGSRYQTADAIAMRVIALLGESYDGTAFVTTGGNFPDALAAAPLAASKSWPIFLANPDTGLSDETRAAMAGVTDVLVLGSTGAVSGDTETYLNATYGDAQVYRLEGPDRYSTAATIAEYGVVSVGLSWDGVAIATGVNFPDALAAGVLQGRTGSVMLLTASGSLSAPTQTKLAANKDGISEVTVFGSTSAVSNTVRTAVENAIN